MCQDHLVFLGGLNFDQRTTSRVDNKVQNNVLYIYLIDKLKIDKSDILIERIEILYE